MRIRIVFRHRRTIGIVRFEIATSRVKFDAWIERFPARIAVSFSDDRIGFLVGLHPLRGRIETIEVAKGLPAGLVHQADVDALDLDAAIVRCASMG